MSGGKFVPLPGMKTSHLINTAKMIWNHAAPPGMRLSENFQKYNFSPFYTAKYMGEAFCEIMKELAGRSDPFADAMADIAIAIKNQIALSENELNKAAGCNLRSLEKNKNHPHLRLAAPITMRFDPEPELNEFGDEADETSGGGF
jgi:hypothetical protein